MVRERTLVVVTRTVLLALCALVAGLAPLAHASATDPTWIAGLYDDGDYDDVVLAITGNAGAIDPDHAPTLRAFLAVHRLAPGPETDSLGSVAGPTLRTRAPPTA